MKTLNVPTFRFHNLEITPNAVVLHFHEDKTVIPLSEIKNYRLEWHLHDPVFGKKWWFLVLTVELEDAEEESAPIASLKFNYLEEGRQSRHHVERTIADALDAAIARTAAPTQKMICI